MVDNRTTELESLSKLKMAGRLRYWRGTIEIPESELHAICDEIQAEHDHAIAATMGSEREIALEELVLDMWHELNYTSIRAEDGCNKCLEKMAAFDERMKDLGLMEVDE